MTEADQVSLYEIVELDSGEIVLKRVNESESEPLVAIRFSKESKFFLGEARLDIARTMIESGLDSVSSIKGQSEESEEFDLEEASFLVH